MTSASFRDALDGVRMCWVNRSAWYAVGSANWLPVTAIAAFSSGTDHEFVGIHCGAQVYSWQPDAFCMRRSPDEVIEGLVPALADRIAASFADYPPGGRKILYCPRLCRSAWQFAMDSGLEFFGPEPGLAARLRDKRYVLPELARHGVTIAPGRWSSAFAEAYSSLVNEFGLPFVAQAPISDSGAGTAVVESPSAWDQATRRFQDREIWLAPFLGRLSVNVNACVHGGRVAVAWPSIQLTGLQTKHRGDARYLGNDYCSTLSLGRGLLEEIRAATEIAGHWLDSLGYAGIFGLDYVIGPSGRPVAVDLNARWQGSTSILAQAQEDAGTLPLPVWDLAARLNVLSSGELDRHAERLWLPVSASQRIVLSESAGIAETRIGVKPGVYADARSPNFRCHSVHLKDITGDEFLVCCDLPSPGMRIETGAPLFRIVSRKPMLDAGRMNELEWLSNAAMATTEAFELGGVSAERADAK